MSAGEYELLERIGGAGGRELWRARDGLREVVIERGPREGLDRPRFEREVRAASSIEHAAIPRVLAHGLEDGRPWVAHELAAGMTLGDLFGGRRLSPEAALVLVHPIAGALAALHAAGVVHGGVCMENVIVSPLGDVRLVGIELAARGERARVPPERAEGRDVDASADVWSLGDLLRELIAGRSELSVDRRVAPELEWLIGVCLASEPWKRPRDGRALMERLAPLVPCAIERLRAERVALLSDPVRWQREAAVKARERAIADADRAHAAGDSLGALRAVERVLAYRPDDPEALAERATEPVRVQAAPPPARSLPGWTHGLAAALGTGVLLASSIGAVIWIAVEDEHVPVAAAREPRIEVPLGAERSDGMPSARRRAAAEDRGVPSRSGATDRIEPLRLDLVPDDLPPMTEGLAVPDAAPILALDDRGFGASELAAAEARLARDPSDGAARVDRVAALLALGRAEGASELEALEPSSEALALGGIFALRRGRFEEADARLTEALGRDAGNVRARLHRGVLRSRLGRARDGYRDLLQVIEARPESVIALAELARIESRAGHPRHAAPLLRRVVRERPRSADAWIDLALALGPSAEAIRALDRALVLDPASARASRERCIFLEATRGTGALRACNEAIGRIADDAELFAARASVRSVAGQHEEALSDASRAIALRPDVPRYLYERQALRRRAGDDGGAFRDLSAACAMRHERACRELEARGVRAP